MASILEAQEDLECYYPDEIVPFADIDFEAYRMETPEFLYHVSVAANMQSIARDGIQPMSQEKKRWRGCNSNYTYWSRILKEAASFVGDLRESDMLLCYKVGLEHFRKSDLFVDRMLVANFEDWSVPVTFEYHGGISADKLFLMGKAEVLKRLEYEDSNQSRLYVDTLT